VKSTSYGSNTGMAMFEPLVEPMALPVMLYSTPAHTSVMLAHIIYILHFCLVLCWILVNYAPDAVNWTVVTTVWQPQISDGEYVVVGFIQLLCWHIFIHFRPRSQQW